MSTELPYAHYDLSITRDLCNGLLLRWSSSEDTEELVYLNSMVFRDSEDAPPNTNLGKLVQEFMSGRHPLMGPHDFAVIEDTRRAEHRIVVCTCFWSQAWEYEGIHIGLGRPELVATDPAYRNRGLVRALFEEIHARSEAQGDLVQGITGISYFYRQFGYEYALNLGGRRVTNLSLIPQAKEPEPYLLRDAAEADIPFILTLYDRRRRESIVSSPIEERWRSHQNRTCRPFSHLFCARWQHKGYNCVRNRGQSRFPISALIWAIHIPSIRCWEARSLPGGMRPTPGMCACLTCRVSYGTLRPR